MTSVTVTMESAALPGFEIRPSNIRLTHEDYRESFDTLACQIRMWKFWNVKGKVADIWARIHPRIHQLLQEKRNKIRPPQNTNYHGPSQPIFALRCFMVGLSLERAHPHVAIISAESWLNKKVQKYVLRAGFLKDEGWGKAFLPIQGEIRQTGSDSPKASVSNFEDPLSDRETSSTNRITFFTDIDTEQGLNLGLSSRIRVWEPGHQPRSATLGGVVQIRGEWWALTVQHVFMAPLEREEDRYFTSIHVKGQSTLSFDVNDLDIFKGSDDELESEDTDSVCVMPLGKQNLCLANDHTDTIIPERRFIAEFANQCVCTSKQHLTRAIEVRRVLGRHEREAIEIP
jgi:hypothetical protein